MSNPQFNPFSARQRNTRIKWFETDLESFYAFVQAQPLLKPEQEFLFGRTIKMWSQVEHIREQLLKQKTFYLGNGTISNEELANALGCSTETIEKIYRYAEISKTKLVNSNLKLVLAIVSRYRTAAIPNAELIAEGTRGLSKAALRYDYSKGFRFATYATWYVHQAVSEHVRWRKHPAKMPSRYVVLHRLVKQFSSDFRTIHRRFPTVSEISAATKSTPFDIVKVLSMNTYPHLLHSPISSSKMSYKGDNKDRTFEDITPSVYNPPLDVADNKDLRKDMEKLLHANLSDAERDVIRLRLGLDDGREKPLKEVGKMFHISWKQVRNLEREALTKLLSSKEIDGFVNHYHEVS
jgi:RNA polymerase primary sigma factor